MARLLRSCDARAQVIDVVDPGTPRVHEYYQVGDELVVYMGDYRKSMRDQPDPSRWNIARGQAGTFGTTHARGANITPFSLVTGPIVEPVKGKA